MMLEAVSPLSFPPFPASGVHGFFTPFPGADRRFAMKKIFAGAALAAALTAGGVVYAQAQAGATSTRAEAQAKAEEHFTRMDANRDSKIDSADREAHHAAMFDKMDTDKNGQLSRAEFTAMHSMHGAAAGGDHAIGEHRGGRHGMGMGGRGRRGGMMQMADANKDGAISRQEFVAGALNRFDRSDTNKDGKVTAEERRASRMAMRSQMHGGMDHADDAGSSPDDK